MIKAYLKEKSGWIILFISIQLLILFVTVLDSNISMDTVYYGIFLASVIFIIFLTIRYRKETVFYQSLKNWDHTTYDTRPLAKAESPFEQIIYEKILEQTQYFQEVHTNNIKQLEEEKDELLSWIHEVKTPLTTLQLLIERCDDPQLKRLMEYEWMRIHLLLDQQLHQKRMYTLESDLYIESATFESIIYPEIKALQPWCMQKGIGFDIQLHVSDVLTDRKWFRFVIRQVLTNAVKYSEQSDIVIKSYEENEHTKLTIQDSGRGISKQDLPRIFDKGFTSTSDHQNQASTGMGLYLAKKTADALLLQFDVDSKLNQGTTFTITFPNKNEFTHLTSM